MTSARMTRLGTSVEKPLTLHIPQVATPQVVGGASSERLRSHRTIPDLEMYGGTFVEVRRQSRAISTRLCYGIEPMAPSGFNAGRGGRLGSRVTLRLPSQL